MANYVSQQTRHLFEHDRAHILELVTGMMETEDKERDCVRE